MRSGNKETALDALERLARQSPAPEPGGSPAVAIGKRYIAAHYREPVSLSLIAEKAGVTESYMSA